MDIPWRIELLGGLRAVQGTQTVTRFRTRKTGSLLAYLAFYRDRTFPRESLTDLLWPDDEMETGRHSLRVALSSLRHQLEPSGIQAGNVVVADRKSVRLNPGAVTTDVMEFEMALAAARRGGSDPERIAALRRAIEVYGGELLPGYHESWIVPQQLRLEDEYVQAVVQLVEGLEQSGEAWNALEYAGRAASVYPLREELHLALMRLYMASGQGNAARRQYERLAELLQNTWGESPSKTVQEYAASLSISGSAGRSAAGRTHVPTIRPVTPEATPSEDSPLPSNQTLSLPISRFFGREQEITTLVEWLRADPPARLITLTGAGGCGKTRLSREVAGRLREAFPECVWFVSLAELNDGASLPRAILEGMGLAFPPTRPPLEQVIGALAEKPCLLVLDNFEHLVETGASVVQAILERATTVSCLVTSRQRLNLSGEREMVVSPLPVPTNSDSLTALLEYACVQLFVERARAALPDFDLTRANAQAVTELCTRLEGIPLALELAAARASVLTPGQMLGHLSSMLLADRATVFENRQRGTAPRHRTLRAAMDWSFRLLDTEQQRFFCALSVFRGGWTAEAAEYVLGGRRLRGIEYWVLSVEERESSRQKASKEKNPTDTTAPQHSTLNTQYPSPTLDLLTDLRERSLIQAAESEGAMRFSMLETLREYADLALEETARTEFRRRHQDHYCRLAEQAQGAMREGEVAPWLKRLDRDADNFRAALDREPENDEDHQTALRLAAALWSWWSARGYLTEGRTRLAVALSYTPTEATPTATRAEALVGAGTLARMQGDPTQARQWMEECLTVSRAVSDARNTANALYNLGIITAEQGDYLAARSFFEESLSIRRSIAEGRGIAASLVALGIIARHGGNYAEARSLFEESLSLRRTLNDLPGIAGCLHNLGAVTSEQGDHTAAVAYYEQAIEIHREVGDRRGMATALTALGTEAKNLGNSALARTRFEESLVISRESGDRPNIAITLVNLGPLAILLEDYVAARAYLTESLSLAHSLAERRVCAFGLEGFASLARAQGQLRRAATLYAAGDALREAIHVPRIPIALPEYERIQAALREALGVTEYENTLAFGRALSLSDAIENALSSAG